MTAGTKSIGNTWASFMNTPKVLSKRSKPCVLANSWRDSNVRLKIHSNGEWSTSKLMAVEFLDIGGENPMNELREKGFVTEKIDEPGELH